MNKLMKRAGRRDSDVQIQFICLIPVCHDNHFLCVKDTLSFPAYTIRTLMSTLRAGRRFSL